MNLYRLLKVIVNGTEIPVYSGTVDPGIARFMQGNGVSIDPTYVATSQMQPTVSADTHALSTLLGVFGFASIAVTTYEVWFADRGNSAAVKIAGTTALGVFDSITGTGGDSVAPASASFSLHPYSTSDNAPWTITTGLSIPTYDLLGELFVISHAVVKTSAVYVSSATLDMSPTLVKRNILGRPWPGYVGTDQRDSTITISTPNTHALGSINEAGELVTNTEIWFRGVDQGGWRKAVGESEHIKILVASAHATQGTSSGSWPNLAETQLIIKPIKTGTNNPVAITTATAIS